MSLPFITISSLRSFSETALTCSSMDWSGREASQRPPSTFQPGTNPARNQSNVFLAFLFAIDMSKYPQIQPINTINKSGIKKQLNFQLNPLQDMQCSFLSPG